MLGAMNFWIGIVLYAVNNSNFNKDPNKRSARKFSDTILHAFEVAKTFIIAGKEPNSTVINPLAGTKITDKDLSTLLNGPKRLFKDLTDHKKVLATIRNLGKKYNTFSGIYI